jgi:hypothetical protein
VAAVLIQISWKLVRRVVLMISRSGLNMGHLRSKIRSQELKIKKFVNSLVAAVLIQIFWKFVRKVVLMISKSSLNMGHLGSKGRSHCPIMEKKNLVNTLEFTFLTPLSSNLVRMQTLLGCG